MYTDRWHDRVGRVIRGLPSRSYLQCSRDSGIQIAIQRLQGIGLPLICIWIDDVSNSDVMGERLSEAVTSGLGSALIRKGVSYTEGLRVLADYQLMVGPIHIVVGWASVCEQFVQELAQCLSGESSMLIVSDSSPTSATPLGFESADATFLNLSFSEAVREARGILADADVASLLEASSGCYGYFRRELLKTLRGVAPEPQTGDSWEWSEGIAFEGLLEALKARSLWSDAFELACSHLPERLEEFIDEAGNWYFDRGAYEYLWSRLNGLPPDIKRFDKIAYWLASTAIATNRRREQSRYSVQVLTHAEAPELRAATAVATPSETMLQETSRAVGKLRSPATLRAHGYALDRAGNRTDPILLFREAMRLAERDKAHHLVVACGIDIAELEIRQGKYGSGAEWAHWALEEYRRRGLNERLRYASGLATLAFARLLLGEREVANELLREIDLDDSLIEIPSYEAVVSTAANLAFTNLDYVGATDLYSINHSNAPIEAFCFTALDLVGAYFAQEREADARQLADQAFTISRSSSKYEQALGDLSMGIAYSRLEPQVAEQHLLAALDGLVCTTANVHTAQAAIWLAIVRLQQDRRKDAVEALRIGVDGIQELGQTGWCLLSANHPLTGRVQELWSRTEVEFEFHFLGAKQISDGCKTSVLGIRAAELLAILGMHPAGLSAERLHTLQYGDLAYKSTLKANISRLRSIVPIGSNPYRIDATFQADFLQLLDLISTGELQKALNLYKGPLLPESESPTIIEWREHIEESLRLAVIDSGDPDNLIQLATLFDDDLEIWEHARNVMPVNDYRRPVVNARIRRIRASWVVT